MDADVVALYNAGVVAEQLRRDGVPVTDLAMRSNRQVGAVLELAGLMRQGRYDVVHTHLYRACLYGRVAARMAGVPRIVATEHSLLDDQLEGRPATRGVRMLYLAGERFGQLTIAVSQAVRTNLLRWGVAPDRVVCIPNGLDLAALTFDGRKRAAVRAALGIPSDAQVVGAVGRLHEGKRFDELIAAVAPSLCPARRLVIVGEGPARSGLEAAAARAGVADLVHLVGERPVAPHLSAMDVLVSPSVYETFGLAVLEGLANGLPVVYRRCPALDELPAAPAAAVRLGPATDLRAAVEDVLGRARDERTAPVELGRFDVREVAAAVDDVYARAPVGGSVRATC
jgi:glycosyltransferase involved in cell wall biosynthesis